MLIRSILRLTPGFQALLAILRPSTAVAPQGAPSLRWHWLARPSPLSGPDFVVQALWAGVAVGSPAWAYRNTGTEMPVGVWPEWERTA
jgi:hypothetical protein